MLGSAPSLLFSRSVAELNTFALLTNSLVMMMLLVQGPPHFENYCSRAISCEPILSFWMISSVQTIYFLKISFIYFEREGKGGRKGEKQTSLCERNINLLLLPCNPTGDWATTQASAPTGNPTVNFCFSGWRSTNWVTPVGHIQPILELYINISWR